MKKKINRPSLLILVLTLTLLSACGGGGGGGGVDVGGGGNTIPQPTAAVLTLSTADAGTIPATTTINSYDVMITLPAGVSVKASPDSINPAILVTDPGVVTVTGPAETAGSVINAIYTPAAGATPGSVRIRIASATGFGAGEFCKVNCDIAAGNFPTASDFVQPTLTDASGWDSTAGSTVSSMQTMLSLTATAVVQ